MEIQTQPPVPVPAAAPGQPLNLLWGSGLVFLAALLHLLAAVSAELSAYLAEAQMFLKPGTALSAGIALVLTIFGVYGLAGAGTIGSLPMQRKVLLFAGGLCALRGIQLLPQLLTQIGAFREVQGIPVQNLLASGLYLAAGILYLRGTLL